MWGGTNDSNSPQKVSVKVIDGVIENATVTDSKGATASYKQDGVYEFETTPEGFIEAKNGVFQDTNLQNKATYKVGVNTKVLSPLTTFAYNFKDKGDFIRQSLSIDSLDVDYIHTDDKNLAKLSQLLYILQINDLSTAFSKKIVAKTTFEDLVSKALETINESKLNTNSKTTTAKFVDDVVKISNDTKTNDYEKELESSKTDAQKVANDTTADITYFDITSFSPLDKSTGIGISSNVIIEFDKELASLEKENVVFKDKLGGSVDFTISIEKTKVTLAPVSLNYDTTYTVSVKSGIKAKDGSILKDSKSMSFTTFAPTAFQVSNTNIKENPIISKDLININDSVIITFSNSVDKNSIADNLLIDGVKATTYSLSANELTIKPTTKWLEGEHTITIKSALKDIYGTTLGTEKNIEFLALDETDDGVAPTVKSTNPADGDTGVALNPSIFVYFDKYIASKGIYTKFTLKETISGDKVYDDMDIVKGFAGVIKAFKVYPKASLKASTQYTLTLENLEGIYGKKIAKQSFTFTTASSDTTPPEIERVYYLNKIGAIKDMQPTNSDLPLPPHINIKFNEKIKESSIANGIVLTNTTTSAKVTLDYYSTDNYKLIQIRNTLEYANSYKLEITTDVEDLAGNKLDASEAKTFKFSIKAKPTSLKGKSAFGSANKVYVSFGELVELDSFSGVTLQKVGGSSITITGAIVNGSKIVYTLSNSLVSSEKYKITIPANSVHLKGDSSVTNTGTTLEVKMGGFFP